MVKKAGRRRRAAEQPPLSIDKADKGEARTQFAALCYRMKAGKTQVLLISSRGRKRWILPKGWPMPGQTPGAAALQEAWEEAGVQGRVIEHCLGVFPSEKILDAGDSLPILTMVYPVKVKALATSYPERDERRRKWFGLKKAAMKVTEPELAHILQTFDPLHL